MHKVEKNILRLSMTVLFLSIVVVYVLFYQVNISRFEDYRKESSDNVDNKQTLNIRTGSNSNSLSDILKQDTENSGNNMIDKQSKDNVNNISSTGKTDTLNTVSTRTSASGNISNIHYLSGTSLFYGILESVEKMGISYKYILKDNKSIYFVYLGDFTYDIASIARKLGGNIYTINTQQEILKNKLFGDKIMFINLPEYKNKLVLLIVEIEKKYRLLQVDYNTYHNSKTYLKNLFID